MPRERMYSSNAERQAAYRARLTERQALAETGQLIGRLAGAPGWAKDRVQDQLAAALARVAELEASVGQLDAQQAAAETTPTPPGGPTPNRAARRAAERDRRRRH